MADAFGIQAAVQRSAPQGSSAPAAPTKPAAPAPAAQPAGPTTAQQITTAFIAAPGTVRVAVPPRPEGEERQKARKAPNSMTAPSSQDGGRSPISSAPVADTFGGVEALAGRSQNEASIGATNSHHEPATSSGEAQADADFVAGRYASFNSSAEFLAELGA
jgi:hypothetical protein